MVESTMKAALFIIDMQKDFFNINQTSHDTMSSAIEFINAAIELFRKINFPVVVVQHKDQGRDLVPGNPQFKVSDELKLDNARLKSTQS